MSFRTKFLYLILAFSIALLSISSGFARDTDNAETMSEFCIDCDHAKKGEDIGETCASEACDLNSCTCSGFVFSFLLPVIQSHFLNDKAKFITPYIFQIHSHLPAPLYRPPIA